MQLNNKIESLVGEGSLKKMIPADQYKILEVLFSPCCGLGKKTVKLVDGSGNSFKAIEFPITFDGASRASKEALEDAICETYGNGYSAFIMSPGNVLLVIGNRSNSIEGIVDVPDTLEIV